MSNDSGLAAWLLGWLNTFLQWVLDQVAAVFVGVWDLLKDLLIYVLDTLFELVLYIVSGMSWSFGTFSPGQYYALLPAELVNVLNVLGVPTALGMIVAALGIRFVLQLIPLVRLGS